MRSVTVRLLEMTRRLVSQLVIPSIPELKSVIPKFRSASCLSLVNSPHCRIDHAKNRYLASNKDAPNCPNLFGYPREHRERATRLGRAVTLFAVYGRSARCRETRRAAAVAIYSSSAFRGRPTLLLTMHSSFAFSRPPRRRSLQHSPAQKTPSAISSRR